MNKCSQASPGGELPQAHCAVTTSRNGKRAVGRESRISKDRFMSDEAEDLSALSQIPETQGAVLVPHNSKSSPDVHSD